MIRLLLALLLWLVLQAPPDPHLRAQWNTPTSATVRWTQESRGCLWRVPREGAHVFVGCFDGTGNVTISFGRVGPLDGTLRPTAGDVYLLTTGGQTWRALLAWRSYMPVWRA